MLQGILGVPLYPVNVQNATIVPAIVESLASMSKEHNMLFSGSANLRCANKDFYDFSVVAPVQQ